MEYSEKVVEHYTNPRNVGKIENASGVGEVGNPVCGDIMKMFIKVENNIIVDVKFKTFGCGAAIATSSISTEMIKGKTIEEALELKNTDVVNSLDGLPPVKLHCSVLAEEAIHEAIADYYRKTRKINRRGNKANMQFKRTYLWKLWYINEKRVLLGMSGRVDSSVSAILLFVSRIKENIYQLKNDK